VAVKRRVIWMSDEEWATIGQVAKMRGETISGVLRDFLVLSRLASDEEANPPRTVSVEEARAVGSTIGGPSFSTRPFTPVPKGK
jgi:hypothetical protein